MSSSKFDTPECIEAYLQKRRQVSTDKFDWPIGSVFDKIVHEKVIKLDPEFQRRYVWDQAKASQLIESILMGVPLPTIYLAENSISDEAIDGQQRLTTIVSFMQGFYPDGSPFVLRRLKELSMLNGASYKDLPREMTKQFTSFNLSVIKLKESSHEGIKFDVFERLNKGSEKLNEQEIRNCIYRGSLNSAVKEFVKEPRFKRIFNFPEKQSARMEDCGFVIAYLCFVDANGKMRGDPKTTINRYMAKNKDMSPDEIKLLFRNFMDVSEGVFTLFGENSFRKYYSVKNNLFSEKQKKSGWESKINTAIALSMMYAVSHFPKQQIVVNSEAIREEILNLMTIDQDFVNSILSQTTCERHMTLRIEKIKEVIQKCVTNQGPRLFPFVIKEALYRDDPTCKLCSQRISHIDDSHVDHIIRWADGGSTTLDNAQLTHRYCNLKKG
ncbi:HNH endonuclease family protein [Pseudomonas putida]|uniref:DUF262 domain-containing protein n=1 Tax=Pseudomonas putida TaxID=303 RepID=A0A8I1EDI6_PSEPU|nr:DUF262 domain-containing protein [Pseudomonas putida]MBI6883279.1 DUF262 domain-containing protein [Pseudomonas putida]